MAPGHDVDAGALDGERRAPQLGLGPLAQLGGVPVAVGQLERRHVGDRAAGDGDLHLHDAPARPDDRPVTVPSR